MRPRVISVFCIQCIFEDDPNSTRILDSATRLALSLILHCRRFEQYTGIRTPNDPSIDPTSITLDVCRRKSGWTETIQSLRGIDIISITETGTPIETMRDSDVSRGSEASLNCSHPPSFLQMPNTFRSEYQTPGNIITKNEKRIPLRRSVSTLYRYLW